MILKEIDILYTPFNTPVQKKNTQTIKYRFEWVDSSQNLEEIQKFRAIQFSTQFDIQFPQHLDQDTYDLSCKHAVLRDEWSNEIIAYTRVKFLYGYDIQQSYSQQEFHLDQVFLASDRIVEMGRTCVHSQYRSTHALSILWANVFNQFITKVNADYLIGCVSVKMQGNEYGAYNAHHYIQQLSLTQSCSVQSKDNFEMTIQVGDEHTARKLPKLFDVYLKMNAQLSKQAYYDADFNCLDYFVLMDVKQMRKKF